jgi:hypothetical protein
LLDADVFSIRKKYGEPFIEFNFYLILHFRSKIPSYYCNAFHWKKPILTFPQYFRLQTIPLSKTVLEKLFSLRLYPAICRGVIP